jgi:hypothetical protein
VTVAHSQRALAIAGGAASFLLCACGALMHETNVGWWFERDFHCEHGLTAREPGGYVVTGCGIVAHYRCMSHESDKLFDSDLGECFLAGSDDESARMPQLPPAEPVSTHEHAKLGVIVRGRAEVAPGVQLMVLGAPLKEPHKVVLELHAPDPVTQGNCSMRLYRDGSPLPVLQASSIARYDLRIIIDVAGLNTAQTSLRIAGDGCGVVFEFGEEGRRMLGLFAARFQEELAKAAPPPKQ